MKTLLQIAVFPFVIALGTIHLIAQDEIKNPARGFQPGSAYSISDIENINTTNGNLTLTIPLVKLPKGRGDVGQGISLIYNSKLYDTSVEELQNHSGQISDQNMLVRSDDAGWRYAVNSAMLLVVGRFDEAPAIPCDGTAGGTGKNAYLWKVQLLMPDGSRKEFRPTSYSDLYNDGFFNISPNGYLMHACPTGGNPSATLQTSGPMVYYSTDGSYTRLVIDHNNNGDVRGTYNSWTMYLPDGGRMTGGVGINTVMYDRNNNYIQGTADVFGRSISVQPNASPNEDHVFMSGVNGEQLMWKVTWRTITVSKTYETTAAASGRGRGNGTSTQTLSQSFRVVDRITLPTQLGDLYYEFGYNSEPGGANGFGEVSHIRLPSGAVCDYQWTTPIPGNTGAVLRNFPSQKTLSYLAEYDGSPTPVSDVWKYDIDTTGSIITQPDGRLTAEYHGDTSYENLMSGLTYMTVGSDGMITEKIWAFNRPTGANTTANINAYVKTEFTTIPDSSGNPALTAIKDFTVDPNGNQVQIKEYDWVSYSSVPKDSQGNATGIPSAAPLKRVSVSEFYNSASGNSSNAYWNSSVLGPLNLIKSTEVQDGAGTPKSRTEMSYDYTIYSTNTLAGNVSQTKVWDSFKGGQVRAYSNPLTSTNSDTTTATYNSYGMPLTATDANGNVTQITYGNVAGPSGNVTDLYPTQTVSAYGTAVARTSTAVYDFYTGLATSATDVDNGVTNATVYDDLGRPVKAITGQGTALESWTTTEYHDADRYVVLRSDLETKGDGKKVATQFYDQLGRVRLSKTLEDASTQSATNETDGIKVQTRYLTDYNSGTGVGHTYQLGSNPYRAATSGAASSEPTMGWTLSTALNTGRHSQVETFSGTSLPAPWGNNTSSTGVVTTDIDSDRTLVTDQTLKQRISRTNALGQLTDVWEITAPDQWTTAVAFPNTSIATGYQTSYSYDTLNNLTAVNQGSQQQPRTFSYSSLSRLISATNPESGTISYAYDANGNLTSKLDARTITTSYTYDALNRVTQRQYTNEPSGSETPDVAYTYGAAAPAIGKLIKVTTGTGPGTSTTEYTSFDILGRVTASKQTTDGVTYGNGSTDCPMTYTYNLSGALVEQQYPSCRVISSDLKSDGTLAAVASRKDASEPFWSYASSFTYNPSGAVTSMELGNGEWESTIFNTRLQPTDIDLGTVQGGSNLLNLHFDYGTTQNNGNVQSQTITVPTVGINTGFVAVQSYSYDSLNRLKDATENVTPNNGTASQSWKQEFSFDRYGNRNFVTGTGHTTTIPGGCSTAQCNPAVDSNNNRFSSGQNYSYDSAGNTTTDAQGRTFVYDAENKQTSVSDSGGLIGQYWYDGDGKRVKKFGIAPDGQPELTIFVYDAAGKEIAEYSTDVADSNTAKVSYLTADHLGSPRINTDQNGAIIARHDYMPFGEEIDGTGGRTTGLNYGDDTIRKQFTGYERDRETDLDFAQARFFSSLAGRFTSPDERAGKRVDPQTLNRYVYARNNPHLYVDPAGEELVVTGDRSEDYIRYLSEATGYALHHCVKDDKFKGCTKEGAVVIDADQAQKTEGTSRKLAAKLKEVIGLKNASGKSLTVDIAAVSKLNNSLFDSFQRKGWDHTGVVDVGDLDKASKAAYGKAFIAGNIGHVLEEYSDAEVYRDAYPGSSLKTSEGNPITHSRGLAFESEVVSDILGETFAPREELGGGEGDNYAGFMYVGSKSKFYFEVKFEQDRYGQQVLNVKDAIGVRVATVPK